MVHIQNFNVAKVIIHNSCGEQFYGTEFDILAGFEMVGSAENGPI